MSAQSVTESPLRLDPITPENPTTPILKAICLSHITMRGP